MTAPGRFTAPVCRPALLLILLLLLLLLAPPVAALAAPLAAGTVSGSLVVWGEVRVDFVGSQTHELALPNPFTDRRLDVTFRHIASGKQLVVPGYYAADGSAADTGAGNGGVWRAHLLPDLSGAWSYTASFRKGPEIATSLDINVGTPTDFHGATGSFTVQAMPAGAKGFHKDGLLSWVNDRYLRFAGSGRPWVKTGTDSPENLLAFADFDATPASHHYATHAADWTASDPSWAGGRGKGLIGALNYLSSRGVNSAYFLTFNVGGDGNDVWPWTSSGERQRFDVSKLAQWNRVFDHMTNLGIALHVVTQETENDDGPLGLDAGGLGTQRKLYYRELVARFAHQPALQWNLGEENSNTAAQHVQFIAHLKALDPYDHPIVVHTYPTSKNFVFDPLIAAGVLDGAALQVLVDEDAHSETATWIGASQAGGRPWAVTVDEIGPPNTGVAPDAVDSAHDDARRHVLWGNLMAGGGGVEWYFGYAHPNDDLDCEDFRSRSSMWNQSRTARQFIETQLATADLDPADGLVTAKTSTGATVPAWCLAEPGQNYVVYMPLGGSPSLNLGTAGGVYEVRWYDTLIGGAMQIGTAATVNGTGVHFLGGPPHSPGRDWAATVRRTSTPNQPPTITGTVAIPGTVYGGEVFAVTFTVADPDGLADVTSVLVHFFAPGPVFIGTTPAFPLPNGKFVIAFNEIPALPPGQWMVMPVATDTAGNIAVASKNFTAL